MRSRNQEKETVGIIVVYRRARLFDALALLVAIVVIILDQVTKTLVVAHLSPPESKAPIPIIGNYLSIYYIQNSGAAFSLLANNAILIIFIAVALCIIVYLYVRMLNNGPMGYKLIFGMIIGGAAGNLIDRALHAGYVVDFIFFQVPQIGYRFAIFNFADASISIGVILLLFFVLAGGLRQTRKNPEPPDQDHPISDAPAEVENAASSSVSSSPLQPTKHDV
jgi:signal peptidase II